LRDISHVEKPLFLKSQSMRGRNMCGPYRDIQSLNIRKADCCDYCQWYLHTVGRCIMFKIPTEEGMVCEKFRRGV
jgi:hypothetical protein